MASSFGWSSVLFRPTFSNMAKMDAVLAIILIVLVSKIRLILFDHFHNHNILTFSSIETNRMGFELDSLFL